MERRRSPAQLVAIVAGSAALLAVRDFEARPALFLLVVAGTFAALWRFSRDGAEVSLRTLLVVAVLARALLLPVPLSLSDDAYRYLWDGRVALSGFDPYRLTPNDERLEPLRDELWERTAHRDVETVYPPLALSLFALAAALPVEVFAWKALVALFDVGSCWLLFRIAGRLRVPTRRVIWFAWNPLVVVEGAGMGHVDAIGVFAMLAAFDAFLSLRSVAEGAGVEAPKRSRPALAGALLACGALVKLVPLVLAPLFLTRSRSLRLAVALVATLGLGLLPMLAPSGGAPPGLVRYGVSWEFNGLVFEPLWRAVERVEAAPGVKSTLDAAKTRLARPESVEPLYHYVYPQFLAKVILVLGIGWLVLVGLGVRSPVDATRFTLGGALLLSATGYPWYFLWVLPFAALTASGGWLALSASLFLAYLPRLYGWSEWPVAWLAVWLPFLAVAAVGWRGRVVDGGRQ